MGGLDNIPSISVFIWKKKSKKPWIFSRESNLTANRKYLGRREQKLGGKKTKSILSVFLKASHQSLEYKCSRQYQDQIETTHVSMCVQTQTHTPHSHIILCTYHIKLSYLKM